MKDTDTHHDDHDLGFRHDLPMLLGRRRVLGILGSLGLTAAAKAASALEYVALPWETAGPYPSDGTNSKNGELVNVLTQEGVIRTDLRSSFGEYTGTAEGLPLELELTLLNADGFTPLAGHAIYLWACDTIGKYSMYDLPEANYLRGVGIADESGVTKFTTIFPGCYDGRWPHFHFEVFESATAAVSGKASVLTAQIAMPAAECAAVYASDSRYSNGTRNLGRITLESDNIFADNTKAQVAQQTPSLTGDPTTGYSGKLTIPVDFTADRNVQMGPPPGGFGKGRPPGPPRQ